MNTTLFVEISEITARILVYNEVDRSCHYLDVTGGYGKKSIPLHIHYLEDGEVLIGEDAILYDADEGSIYIDSVLNSNDQVLVDFLKILLAKVKELVVKAQVSSLVLITDNSIFKSSNFKSVYQASIHNVDLVIISVEEAVAAWYYNNYIEQANSNKAKENLKTFAYLDYKYFHMFKLEEETYTKNVRINKNKIALDLNAINEYYISSLHQIHNPNEEIYSYHQIYQLYNSQKATLHKQLVNEVKVNVYSSLFFPPRKLVLEFDAFKAFKENWYEELVKHECISELEKLNNVDKVIVSGGYDLIQFLKSFEEFVMPEYEFNEYLLLEGAYSYYQYRLMNKDIIYKESLDYTIGVFNNKDFYPIIEESCEFKAKYELDLILTDYQKEIQLFTKVNQDIKPLYTINIKEPKEIQKINLRITINSDKEIDEVSYELRRL